MRFVRTAGGPGFADSVLGWHGSKIVWNGSGWDLTPRDGMVYVFGDNAPLREIRDRFGNRVTITRVGPTFTANRITSPHRRWLELTTTGIGGWQLITQARDNLGRVVTYQYDAQLRLWKVTDSAGV